jgi:predicted NAD-dependent protein-ADP-ribosyltransferase YbiA (DUF1768 family)
MAETEEKVIGAEEVEVPAAAPEVPAAPYDKETITAIENFFKGRAKLPGFYTFTAEGNLEIKEGAKKGKMPPGIVQLRRFVPLEPSERAAIDEARLEALTGLDEEYEIEMDTLRSAMEEYKSTGAMRGVLSSNQRLTEIDARRNAVRSAVRNLVAIENPAVKEILLDQRYEERRLFGNKDPFDKELVRLTLYTFSPEVDQGKYVADELAEKGNADAKKEDEAEKANEILYRQRLKDGRPARVFYDTDSDVNGFMSPMWAVDFTLNVSKETRYSSPIQAYEVERARELGEDALAESLLKTRSPRTIRLLTRKTTGHPKDAKGLWVKIYTAIYEQYPILKAKLLDTGSDALVFADVRAGPSGIGLAEKDSAVLDPAKWKGENAVGVAQETVRTRMREGAVDEASGAVNPAVGGSITEEEQKKAKVAAIINARRR